MDEPSPKRRRLSPEPDNSEPRKAPRRASFLSPTKASLARFNPNLLKSPNLSQSPRRPPSRRKSQLQSCQPLAERGRESAVSDTAEPEQARRESSPIARPQSRNSLFDDLNLDSTEFQQPVLPDHGNHVEQPELSAAYMEPTPLASQAQLDPTKIEEKRKLQQELKLLREQCNQYERIQERIRKKSQSEPDDPTTLELIQLLNDEQPNSEKGRNVSKPAVSDLLNSFLPFAIPTPTYQTVNEDDDSPVASHKPLELKDPLPCLQLFTPLTFSATMNIPRPLPGDNQNRAESQIHHWHVQGPGALFSADIDMEITTAVSDSKRPEVRHLNVRRISQWARPELQKWADDCSQALDVGALFYSLGSYWDIAMRRAQCWARCENTFTQLMKPPEDLDKENDSSGPNQSKHLRSEILPQLGRNSILIRHDEIALRISWNIKFDWTGEAESEVSASAAFAPLYHNVDGRASLNKVPTTFARLIQSKGVFGAVEAMVGVLFS
ncbi:hypothetical protein NA57DRAFT_57073 [Rhizodiscina lignyota]|uniref:Uncharacterized protein n=1 Tax=Rhizodiscina lignyota TaxID=1504668 RepID=A0A9P4IEL4_9PEZI|nr:hypothetical protein NA57DRAFT_57073 [Rhizodiscina lignyota]